MSSLPQQLLWTLKNIIQIMSPLCPKPSNTSSFWAKVKSCLTLASKASQYDLVPLPPLPTSLASFLLTCSSHPGLMALLLSQETSFCFVFLNFLLLFQFLLKWSLTIWFQMAASIPTTIITPIFCFTFFLALSYFGRPYICLFISHLPPESQLRKDRRFGCCVHYYNSNA